MPWWSLSSHIIWVVPPPSNSGNEGLQGFPTKNVIILVVTLTGRGDNPTYHDKRVKWHCHWSTISPKNWDMETCSPMALQLAVFYHIGWIILVNVESCWAGSPLEKYHTKHRVADENIQNKSRRIYTHQRPKMTQTWLNFQNCTPFVTCWFRDVLSIVI